MILLVHIYRLQSRLAVKLIFFFCLKGIIHNLPLEMQTPTFDQRTAYSSISEFNKNLNTTMEELKIPRVSPASENCKIMVKLLILYEDQLRYTNQFSAEFLQSLRGPYPKFMKTYQEKLLLMNTTIMESAMEYGSFLEYQKQVAAISRYTIELLGKLGRE